MSHFRSTGLSSWLGGNRSILESSAQVPTSSERSVGSRFLWCLQYLYKIEYKFQNIMIVCILLAWLGSRSSEANCLSRCGRLVRVVFGWKIGFRLILFHAGMRRAFRVGVGEFHPELGQCALFVRLMMIRHMQVLWEDCFGFMCYPRLGQAGLIVRK